MLTCCAGGAACTYGPNRAGSRTTTCCVCARTQGWSGFRDRACEPCRVVQVKTPRRAPDSREDAKPVCLNPKAGPKSPGSFGSAVRERRRRRLQGVHDRKAQETSFKRVYAQRRRDEGRSPSKRAGAGTPARKTPATVRTPSSGRTTPRSARRKSVGAYLGDDGDDVQYDTQDRKSITPRSARPAMNTPGSNGKMGVSSRGGASPSVGSSRKKQVSIREAGKSPHQPAKASAGTLTCCAGGAACTYGPNRAGSRTTTCCVCARTQGWSGFRDRACEPCRVVQVTTPRRLPVRVAVDDVALAASDTPDTARKSPGSFGSAVRERRRQRLQGVHDRKAQETSFKRAYDLQRAAHESLGRKRKAPPALALGEDVR